ncbi:serine hydrolase domain-containing protein [Carnobacterium sp.]|uniref:serine hydrolase domain-containing protein n=1 Tax=Carnobacterium sp. TaxID=48221 RepID=UPI00388D474C
MNYLRTSLILVFFLSVILFKTPVFAEEIEESTPSGIPFSKLETFIDDYMEEYIGKTTAGAGVIVLKNGETVLSKGYGNADIENKVKINPNTTIFEWASVSKLVTWASVMQMVEQGKIDLNEDIRNYLPNEFLTKLKYDEPVTMLHLMHHNAGFEEWIFDLGYADPNQVKSLEEGLKIAEPAQVYRPGEVVAYSNFSAALAGYIVERISGLPFEEYVDKHIFTPLGMNTAEYNIINNNNKATGYAIVSPEHFMEYHPYYMSLYPAGGINGTTEDLAKFAAALIAVENNSNKLFEKPETLQEFLSTSYTVSNGMSGNAHGFWEYKGKYRGLTHSGNSDSFSTNLHIVPNDHFSVVITTNQASEVNVTFGLTEELVGDNKEIIIDKELTGAKELEGSYITARREHSNFMNIYYYLMLLKIKPLNESEIEIDLAGMKATYLQSAPNLYVLKYGNEIFLTMKEMYFHRDNGEVTRISTSMNDFLPLPKERSASILGATVSLVAICFIYFIISPITIFLFYIRNKKKKHFSQKSTRWHALLNFFVFAILLNIVVLSIRMLNNYSRPYSDITVQFILNYIFTGFIILSISMLIITWNKSDLSKPQKTFYVISSILGSLFIGLLINWQLFH